MEQFDSSVEESSKVSEQQQKNDKQQCPSCVAELTEAMPMQSFIFQKNKKKHTKKIQNDCHTTQKM